MPELPHVQRFKEYLDATSLHQSVRHVYLSAEKVLADVSGSTLRRHLEGRALVRSRRHGKELFAQVEGDDWLRLHFGMSGFLDYHEDESDGVRGGHGDAGEEGDDHPDPEHVRLRLDFEGGGHLAFLNARRLGEIGWVSSPDAYVEEKGLGPDALDEELDVDRLRTLLEGRRGTIKGALMDQQLIAGIGNEYADEILFQARIHPETGAAGIAKQADELHHQMRRVLESAVEAGPEALPDGFLIPRRHEGGTCPACGAELEQLEVVGRATWICPEDQPEA